MLYHLMRTFFLEIVNKKGTKIGSDLRTNTRASIRFFSKLESLTEESLVSNQITASKLLTRKIFRSVKFRNLKRLFLIKLLSDVKKIENIKFL